MANIYWVGGAGTWNISSTTNWASSSGGTGGTGTVPTAADNVFFDSGSGTPGTVTMTGPLLCLNLSVATGAVNVNYAAIKDSNAQGGATWYAYNSNGNQDLGNNNGWIFAASGLHPVSFGGLTISGGIDLF